MVVKPAMRRRENAVGVTYNRVLYTVAGMPGVLGRHVAKPVGKP